jgi:ABC-2 type transport system ATP-binding protein
MIKDYTNKHGVTVLLSSHNMLEVEYLCDRVALLNNGLTIGIGTPNQLKEIFNAENLEEAFMEATKDE